MSSNNDKQPRDRARLEVPTQSTPQRTFHAAKYGQGARRGIERQEDHGRNPTSGADLFAAKREANTDDYFTFELVQPVPRPIHSRTYLRQNDTQEDGTTSQLAA